MSAKSLLGQLIRQFREQRNITQEVLAEKAGITYQYLSGLENGRENFSIDILESIARAMGVSFPSLVQSAFAGRPLDAPRVETDCFRPHIPLPRGLNVGHLEKALNATQKLVAMINGNLIASGAKPLHQYIQGNNFSGIVSNMLCDALDQHSPYHHNSHQAYPDLVYQDGKGRLSQVGLEVKSTIQIGKGGESHNGHSGWHLVACFKIDPDTGNVRFVHVMLAELNGHQHAEPDWKYVGSKVNPETGSRRTETYNTTLIGTTKLRDGSAYLDTKAVDFSRWRQARKGKVPPCSIWFGK